jgi:hypothetical protein
MHRKLGRWLAIGRIVFSLRAFSRGGDIQQPSREVTMSRFALLFAFAAIAGFMTTASWKAEAAPTAGAKQIAVSAWTINDIMHAACRHRGAHCPRGFIWNGHRCRPC